MTGTEVISLWDRWDRQRSAVKTHVQDIMRYCQPQRANITTQTPEGTDVQKELFDSTMQTACERFATGLYNFMWTPSRTNFMLLPPIEDAGAAQDIAGPLLKVSETIRDEMGRSNFEEAFYESGLDIGAAGLTTLEPSRGDESLFDFTAYPFEQVCFAENRRGRVDSVARRFVWTARQIVQEFGLSNVGKAISDAWHEEGGKGKDKEFTITHAATPRMEYSGGWRDVLNMPIASEWAAGPDKVLLRRSGWPEQRYLVCRFSKSSGQKHGHGPASVALPDVKMVNKIEESVIIGMEQVVRPPILAPDNSFIGKVKLRPGSLLHYRVNAANPGVKPEPFNSGARPDMGVEYAESKRDIIKRAFFNDLFLILSDDKRRTATEVRSILAEKLAMLGPSWGRMKVELFDPMIGILISILAENPSMLRGVPLGALRLANIRYISTLAVAMQYAELSLVEDALLFLSPLGEIDPTIFDNLSFDEIVRGFLQKMAWPVKWLRSRSEVRALREARMQYQAAQMQQQMDLQRKAIEGRMVQRPESGSPAEAMMAEAA